MMPLGMYGTIAGRAVAMALICAPVGCSAFKLGTAGNRPPIQPTETVAGAEEPSAAKLYALDAVEDFLERTRDYDLASTASSSPAPPPEGPASLRESVSRTPARRLGPMARPGGSLPLPAADVLSNTHMTLSADGWSLPSPLALPVVESVSVRPQEYPDSVAEEPTVASITNQPLEMGPDDVAAHALDEVFKALELRVEQEEDFDAEWQLRLMQLALNRDAEAKQASDHLPLRARRLFGAFIDVALGVRRAARSPEVIGDDVVARVDELRQLMAEQTDPIVSVVALCRTVVTFGVYDEMSSEEFIVGRPVQAIVYTEIRNLGSEQTPDGRFKTALGARLELLTADGQSVWHREETEIVDLCRRRRHDFFLAQRITLPPTLRRGDYVLKVSIEDKLSGRTGESVYLFGVGSPTSIAQGK